VRGRGVLFM